MERIAIIPAYEPGEILTELAQQVKNEGFTLIVVDDGSGQKCSNIFTKASEYAVVLTHKENRGKGCALKTAFLYIQEHYPESCTIVTMDSDGQHKVSDAVRLCCEAEKKPGSLILGSRKFKDNVPLRSQFGNTMTRLVYRLSTGLKVHDTQTGLRAFSSGLLPKLLNISGERYEYEMNVLLEFARECIPIKELEIETIYIDDNAGSHFNTFKDSYRVYKEIIKFSASSLLSFLVDYGLYSIFSLVAAGLPAATSLRLANVGARIISASLNYTINRKLVFKSKEGVIKSAGQYFLLAALILIGNTALLDFLVHTAGINRFLAKLFTEMVFLTVSWLVQHCIIFKRKESDEINEQARREAIR